MLFVLVFVDVDVDVVVVVGDSVSRWLGLFLSTI